MFIETQRFGRAEISKDSIMDFPEGILGFEHLKRFAIIISEVCAPIQWLQAVDDPMVSLPIINPFLIVPEYELDVDDSELTRIGKPSVEEILVINVMTLPEDIKKSTINLCAPILINTRTRQGCQVVMELQDNAIRYPAFEALAMYYQEQDKKEQKADAGTIKEG